MTVNGKPAYSRKELAAAFAVRIRDAVRRPMRLMEVCGTHTVSIFRNGIRSLLPPEITLLSGPGCPVCVTAQQEIDAFIALARIEKVTVATFGDLMRVPGTLSTLRSEKADGRDIRMVYSALDALNIAAKNPDRRVVFIGVGFETTAPTIAASIVMAADRGINNFSVLAVHKLVPPVLAALMESGGVQIDGFLLPGHVSVIIGAQAYLPFVQQYGIPCVIAGFEAEDILNAILKLARQVANGGARLENAYKRVVSPEGNPRALALMHTVFEPVDAPWRGVDTIAASGLKIRKDFSRFDARKVFALEVPETGEPPGCACGDVLMGRKTPPQCALYKRICTPANPVGPCMVSSEGTCAAYYRYHGA